MKKGGGKAKGASFERDVCKALGRWVSKGKRDDLFWRSAMSGGRATLGKRKGIDRRHQAGDISSVHPDGHVLTSYWYVECKFVKDLRLQSFMLGTGGQLQEYWSIAAAEAYKHDREPMLIAKQNNYPIIVLIPDYERVKFGWAKDAFLGLIMHEGCNACVLDYERMLYAKPEFRAMAVKPKQERVRIRTWVK